MSPPTPNPKSRLDGAVSLGVHEPGAVAEDAEVGLAVAVPVEEHRDVLRHAAEVDDRVDAAVAVGVDVPDAVTIDDEIGDAVAVDVAGERNIAGNTAEVERLVDGPVVDLVDVPRSGAIDDEIVGRSPLPVKFAASGMSPGMPPSA